MIFSQSFTRSLFTFFFCSYALLAYSQQDLVQAKKYYKQGKYKECLATTNRILAKTRILKPNSEALLLYFLTESDLGKLDKTLQRLYRKRARHIHPNFFFLTYVFMDKALVLGEFQRAVYWGEVFAQRGEKSSLYIKGMYLYTNLLFSNKDYKNMRLILTKLQQKKMRKREKEKLLLLQTANLKKKSRLQKGILLSAYRSKYKRMIFRNLILFYYRNGNKKFAKKLFHFYKKRIEK
ncbi:MAG: hypothetical protein AAF518_05000 [Spirochaetota bacterium]